MIRRWRYSIFIYGIETVEAAHDAAMGIIGENY